MRKVKRSLTVIGEFEPFGLQVVGPSGGSDGNVGEGRKRGGTSKGRYYLFDADTARVRGGGYEYNSVMGGFWDHDQELYIHGNKVIWSGGQQVHKQFSAPTAVLQAKWCRVEAMNEPLLCILHSDCLMTYTPAGEMHSVPLQYSVGSIWPIPCGLLLQRAAEIPLVSSGASTPVKGSPGSSLRDLARDGPYFSISSRLSPSVHNSGGLSSGRRASLSLATPTTPVSSIFALLHPLEEPQAVQVAESGKFRPLADMEEQIIWSSSTVPYLVSFHSGRKQHSIWEIKSVPSTSQNSPVSKKQSPTQLHTSEDSGTFGLQRVWHEKPGQTQADQVFVASDEDGVPILCLVVKEHQRLSAFRLLRNKITEELSSKAHLDVAWTLEAISAAPIIALHPRRKENQHYDLLVLTSDGELGLYTGSYHMCNFFLSKSAAKMAPKGSITSQKKTPQGPGGNSADAEDDGVELVGINDAVTDRVNLLTSTGKIYRCALNLPFSSAVTVLCLSAFAESLRPSLYRYLLKHFLERDFPATEALFLPTPDGKPDVNWAGFSDLILEIIRDMPVARGPPPPSLTKATNTSWEFLLQSGMHKNNLLNRRYVALPIFQQPFIQNPLPHPAPRSVDEKETDEMPVYVSVMMEILEVLHAVYEDCKLDTLRWRQASQLATLLSHLAAAAGELEYVDHYTRDFPTVVPPLPELSKNSLHGTWRTPANLFRWVEYRIKKRRMPRSGEGLPALLLREGVLSVEWSRKVVGFYELLLGDEETAKEKPTVVHIGMSRGTANRPEHKMVLAMVAEAFSLPDLDRLPCGISLPLRHALNISREAPPGDWPPQAYVLVGREDLAATCSSSFSKGRDELKKTSTTTAGSVKNPVVDVDDAFLAAPYMLHLRPITIPQSIDSSELGDAEGQGTAVDGCISDGMDHMSSTTAPLRFGSDLRLNEVRRLLGSSRPVAVRTANSPDVSDPDIVAQQQAQLWQLAQRTTALSFGRGAYTLATSYPLLTETLHIPKLVLAGRLPSQHDATVNLDVNTGNIADLTSWPDFHNGVAAGLRLAPGQGKITRTWIVYNKPDEPSYSHAGFLMSLGLHKHLGVLAATDVYRYLAQEHEATTVGVLLGMAAARRGTMDPAISKMLYLHIPARHPPSFPELELPTLMQSAALMAVGLLYQGSAHRLTTEILLAEIGRKPGGDNPLDREGYALAAGLALGLVTLGRGNDAWGLADLHIEDRLRHYMSGGSEPSDDRQRRPDGFTSSNSLPTASRNVEDLSQAGGQVMEGSMVNLDVTAPGATLALALMFLKTNNKVVAARLAIPDTHFALEYVRPDFILLRLVARSLTLWDSVQATEEWVQAQIPEIVKTAVNTINQVGDTATPPADADMEALAQAHVNILAGACLSIALRYAGTAKPEAQQLLRKYALFFLQEKRNAVLLGGAASPNTRHAYVDRGTLETCLNVAVLSLSVVMAGTGHLQTFRLLRYLRRRNDSDGGINYGNHMAISMAIGFLFLGGGLRTFGTNNGAVAALLIALYPRFPTTPNDHRCHLQAFRHLYVLATEARCVQTVDVDTGLPVLVPLEMTVQNSGCQGETTITRFTPCILPERCSLMRVRVSGARYWPQDIKLPITDQAWWEPGEAGDPFNGGMLYVKRRVGACSYADDPIGCRSLLSRAFQKDSEGGRFEARGMAGDGLQMSKVDQLVSTFSGDPSMLAFAQLLCNFSRNSKTANEFEDFCLTALFESVSTDRPALLQTYLTLYTTVEALVAHAAGQGTSITSICSDPLSLFSLKVALSYCEVIKEDEESSGEPLVQHNFLAALAKKVEDVLSFSKFFGTDATESSKILAPDLVKYFNTAQWPAEVNVGSKGRAGSDALMYKTLLACYLSWYDIPTTRAVQSAALKLRKILPSLRTYASSNSEYLLPILACVLPGTPSHGLLRINPCLPFLNTNLSE
ncbi:anaphase-promoting complex subunit 1 [Marchantia polymorpha subsp. ruderalis]|uniref:Anaphase-promoting complex subunit 1 n=2 Tax=Marchantia polymorpha TaxID=3197 RepID=A0AAF6B650_MARPO|nr:hypothetical protein MARPO_0044s0071 [Marchantia polymorpha]BBN07484.1 hypothetical protein Mp_4g04020 [Marchantia polymorpha subsp. ruderalis]|eukprot:PTQ39615.1 hypothetical protein MARPO_0044s0071 [Marchantia polymorpha]